MKIAIVYNRDSQNVINLFGVPNREKYGLKNIRRIADALKKGKHQVIALEGDKELIHRLEEFMPRVLKGERPGMVFNLSYGIQGQARYTHVPGMLEMLGIPYVGSGPLAHSLSLDKVVAKVIFRQHGLPTPDFAVLDGPDSPLPDLAYPLIVKPRNEAVSFGLKIVGDEAELREASGIIFKEFSQPVLCERYIAGREINAGLIGNSPPEVFPLVELHFPDGGPPVYTWEDKTHKSGREIGIECPAPLDEPTREKIQDISRRAFSALGCYDCARVDMRLDDEGNVYILEINSLPSLGEHGSYTAAAECAGLDFPALINRLVEAASARYFGTPSPPDITARIEDPETAIFEQLTQRREVIEKRLRELVAVSSRTGDPIGIREVAVRLGDRLKDCGLKPVEELTEEPFVWAWQTAAGFEAGTLLVGHLDVPIDPDVPAQKFRRGAEWLHGEGIGLSRAPLVMLEFALRSLKSLKRMSRRPIGVLLYADEGRDCEYSAERIRRAAKRAGRVLVLRPGGREHHVVTSRRGLRKYRFFVEGQPQRLGQSSRNPEVIRWTWGRLEALAALSSRKDRVAVSAVGLRSEGYPMLLPHRVRATVLISYPNARTADELETVMRRIMGKGPYRWDLERLSDRPPMRDRKGSQRLAKELFEVASKWEIPFVAQSSVWPSVAGLVPEDTPVLCGLGPVARDLYTPNEAVQRISLPQRTLLLAQFLARNVKGEKTSL